MGRLLLLLIAFLTSSARGGDWSITMGAGTFSAQDSSRASNEDEITGTWSILSNDFIEFVRTGGDGDFLNSTFYGLEFVDHFLMLPPMLSGETRFTATVKAGASCPANGSSYDYNFSFAKWNNNDPTYATQGGIGGMTYTAGSPTGSFELTSLYQAQDPSSLVTWWGGNYSIPVGSCSLSNSIPLVTATGTSGTDQAGSLYISENGAIYKTEAGRLAYAVRRAAFPGLASITGDYACMLLRDDLAGNNDDRTKYIDVTFNAAGTSGSGYTKSNVSTGSNDMGYGQVTATITNINDPHDGMLRGTIQKGGGSSRSLGCIGTLKDKVVLFCSAAEFDDATMPLNLLCFSDDKRSGRLDHHFDEAGGTSGDGIVVTDLTGTLGNNDAHAKWIGQQSDGKYVVVGYADRNFDATKYAMAVARYNEDGSLDTDFAKNLADANDSDGWRRIVNSTADSRDFERGNWGQIDSSGNIYVFGKGKLNNVVNAIAVRLTSTGAIDTSWGSASGMFATDLGGANNLNAEQFIVDSSNRTVYCGNRKAGSTTRQDYAIWRATSGGSLDTGNFGTSSGYTAITIGAGTSGSYVDKCFTIKEQTVGSTTYYVTGGYEEQTSATDADSALVRFNEDGTQDTTAFTTYGGDLGGFGVNDFIYSLDIDSENRIVTVGFAASPSTSDTTLLIARWNEDGTPDNTFTGSTNYRAHDLTSGQDKAFGISIDQVTGKYYVFGQVGGSSSDDMAVFRFNTDGTLDTNFGPSNQGYESFDNGNGDDESWYGILDSQRRLIWTGNSQNDGFKTLRMFP